MLRLSIFFLISLFVLTGCAQLFSTRTFESDRPTPADSPPPVPVGDVLTGEAVDETEVNEGTTDVAEDNAVSVFAIGGTKFAFDTPQINVKQGDTVKIVFTSNDGFHDWVIDEFNAKTSPVNTGGTSSVTFVADKAGTFEYYCSVGNHRQLGMVGKLIVED